MGQVARQNGERYKPGEATMRITIDSTDETKRCALAAIGLLLPDETTTLETTGYNGWANRETWALCLHLNNDQGLYEGVLDAVRDAAEAYCGDEGRECPALDYPNDLAGNVVKAYAESLLTVDGYCEEFGAESLPAALSRIAEDIGSLYRVDWVEVGAHYTTTLAES